MFKSNAYVEASRNAAVRRPGASLCQPTESRMQPLVSVSELVEPSLVSQDVELAECKGVGHPDTLCDGIAERISHEYVQWCMRHLGGVLHHNFDKSFLLLVKRMLDSVVAG